MKSVGCLRAITSRLIVMVLALAMTLTMIPMLGSPVYADSGLQTQTPVLVVTGSGLIGNDGVYGSDNVSLEKSYTLDELKGLGEGYVVLSQKYSAMKSKDPFAKNYFLVDGVKVAALLGKEESEITDDISVYATDNYAVQFLYEGTYTNGKTKTVGLNQPRYFYNFETGEQGEQVPAVIGWADINTGITDKSVPTALPEGEPAELGFLRLYCGQLAVEGGGVADMNQPLFNGIDTETQVYKIQEGSAIDEVVLTVGSQTYTRADVLMMDFAEAEYSYSTSGGDKTDLVRGVPMSVLLDGQDSSAVVSFEAADGYDMSSASKTVQELIDGNYMLGYEVNGSGVYATAKSGAEAGYGFLTLYGDGAKPSKMVNKLTVTSDSGIDFSTSPYKHITNGGQSGSSPYNIDSITGATLTVEGPGVKSSVPVSVRDLEGRDAGAVRAVYTDKRDGSDVTRMYEGIDLYYILHNMSSGENGIQILDIAKKVLIKNRNRNTIAEFTVEQIEQAHNSETPIIVAYGTSLTDGTNVRPFVFDNGNGADPELGNEDGCIKLVYDKNSITDDVNTSYTKFGNMAYIYVAEAETPGYKHDKAPYQSADISNYVITVTGDKIGREVNYTVQQLENMVTYDSEGKPDNTGMGYRDEYSLANSTYWYVNEYEGVQLWKLLLKSGLDAGLAADEEGKKTIVSSTATDGYLATDKYTIEEVSNPDLFGFYEKNPLDLNDGTYTGNENIREGDDVSTGDKLRVGYPVLVAYGVNGYPYVEKSSQEGYMSGLQNDGGPMRIISGKRSYSHANGSNQAKYLDKIIVGDNTYHYSTHKYSNEADYTALAENELSVKVLNGADADSPVLKEQTYKVGDIEELLYGGSLTRNQLAEAKIKDFYQLTKGSSSYSDLYEGLNLNYFLKNVIELPGYKGTVTFSDGTNELSLSLADVLAADNGSNTETGKTGLSPLLAYGKNGAPMVADKNAAGYQKNIILAEGTDYENSITVKNDGGPLAVLFPHTDSSVSDQSLTCVTSITINLSPDNYAHTNAPYDTYAESKVKIFGEGTRLGTEGKEFTLSELEGKQTIAFTGDYSILKSTGDVSQARYRGINLYSLLTSTDVGLKSNADTVVITTSDGESKEFTLSQIRKSDYINSQTGASDLPVILAYGAGKAGTEDKEDGKPLVAEKTDEGYDADYGNNGGPVRLAVGQTDAEDVNSGNNMKFVASVEVTASEMTSWNHNSSEVYKQYRDETVDLIVNDKDGNNLFSKTFTVGEIEDNTALVERITANVVQEYTWEGIHFWKWVKQEAGSITGVEDPVSVTVFAADDYSQEIRGKFGIDGLENGIKDGDNYVPIILAYGVAGYPLVIGDKSHADGEGYDATAGNNGGPLRLITHNAQGSSLTYVKKIVIVAGDGSSEPEETADFTIKGIGTDDIKMSAEDISNLKNSSGDSIGKAEGEYTVKGTTKKVKGVLLKNLLAINGVTVDSTNITLHTPDAFETIEKGASYNNISLKQAVDQKYLLAYQEWDAEANEWKDIDDTVKGTEIHTNLRMYRNYCDANEGVDKTTDWYDECKNINAITVEVPETTQFKEYPTTGGVRSTYMDKDGTIWVGTYGGGLYYKKAGESKLSVLNTSSEPALKTDFTSAVAADAEGGIWVSQNASYTEPGNNQGVLYIKDGKVTQYKVEDNPDTIADNYVQAIKVDTDGKVWFGSFGGVTIFDPANNTWVTYSKETSGFPATSCNTITLDGQGGAWLGFYPDGSGTTEDPYTGGFCHIDKDGTVSNVTKETGVFAEVWTRNIAIDQKGTVWVVAAGTNQEENVGGVVWKLKSGSTEPQRYTGDELFGAYLDGNNTTEVRTVAVDAEGSLWFGTSADGVLKVSNPKLNADGTMTVDAQYAMETGSWSAASMNNVYSINFWNNGTAYVGTSGGLMVLGEEPAGSDVEPAGDATPEDAALTITGDALKRDGYFSIKGIKNAEGIVKTDATFNWQNSSGTTGSSVVQGATLENIFKDVVGLADGAEIESVEAISSDGWSTSYTADQVLNADLSGNKAMFIWTEDGAKIQKVIVGQFAEGEANKSKWAKDVVKIVVNKKADEAVSLDGAKVVLSAAQYTYNGKVRKPTVKTIDGNELIEGTDYTVKYSKSSPKNVGAYTVTVTGIGKYKDTAKAAFKIVPKGTKISKLTKASKAITVKWKKQSAKMASSRITGYQIQVATDKKFTKNKKTVTVKGYKKVSKKVTKLKAKKKYYVRVRTYKIISGKKYYSGWSAVKAIKTK